MNVQIPVKWLQELLALCGPEDHELRERVMVSITAMDEQAARAVARPEPDEPTPGIASELADMLERSITGLGHYRDSENWSEADEEHIAECNALLDRFNCADDDERALLATATGLPAHVCKDSTPQLHVGDSSFEGWYAGYVKEGTVSLKQNCRDAYAAGMGDPLVVAAPQQADARDAEIEQAVLAERERICAAIKAEDDHCVTQGDYMLDSDDCIKVARGEWERPVYDAAIAAAKGE